ncbi:MAG: hypothetical protein P1P76_05545 [Anaerolineales bacterium]|nr:hypothetical protein [Anaerolineales bacterium]
MVFLSACGAGDRFAELSYDHPSRYYLYTPQGYTDFQQWPLFIALHDSKSNSLDCITEWFEIAEENQFFLLCPELDVREGGLDRPVNERILAGILNELYQNYRLQERFFLAGRGEAASFALRYAFRYPQAIAGVSAIEATSYPGGGHVGRFPILAIVESRDQQSIEAGNLFIERQGAAGVPTRLVEIDGLGEGIPYSVQRLTVDLFEQTSR